MQGAEAQEDRHPRGQPARSAPTPRSWPKKEAAKYKGCEIVTKQTNGFSDTDLTQQVLAFKDAGVDGIVAFDYPNPFGVFVKQMQDNGMTIPILGGASLGLAVDSKAITDASKLVIIDDCVPAVEKSKSAKKFVKAYEKEFGYTPNYVSGQAYDAVTLAADAVQKVGHDPAAIQKAIAGTTQSPVCGFKNDKNNVLGSSRDRLQVQPRRFPQAAEEVPAGVHPGRRGPGRGDHHRGTDHGRSVARPGARRDTEEPRPARVGAPRVPVTGRLSVGGLRRGAFGGVECRRDPLLLGADASFGALRVAFDPFGLDELGARVGERSLELGDVTVRRIQSFGRLGGGFGVLAHCVLGLVGALPCRFELDPRPAGRQLVTRRGGGARRGVTCGAPWPVGRGAARAHRRRRRTGSRG